MEEENARASARTLGTPGKWREMEENTRASARISGAERECQSIREDIGRARRAIQMYLK
jgi:hypothetical protein